MTLSIQPTQIPVPGYPAMAAALARPAPLGEPRPGVIVIHEILGLNDDIRRIATRFAVEGYVAVAPDLFSGLGPQPLCVLRTMAQYWRGGGRTFEALEATRRWLSDQPEVDPRRIGVAGFCMGGGFALLMAVRSPVGAAAAFYGDVPGRIEALRGACPIVAGYGGRDKYFAQQGRRLDRFLHDLGIPHDVAIYPDAGHSYMSQHGGLMGLLGALGPLHATHHAEAAADSWRRLLAFFAEHLDASAAEAPTEAHGPTGSAKA